MTQEERKAKEKEYNKKYRETHREEIKATHKAWRDKNRERLNAIAREKYKEDPQSFKSRSDKYKASHSDKVKAGRHRYKVENRQKCSDYERNRRQNDPKHRFKTSVYNLIRGHTKRRGYQGDKSTWEIIGCDFDSFLNHIQCQFEEGMSLENYGNGNGKWNIDHIEPISKAQNDADIERLNHFSNLRPLWQSENSRRAGRANGKPVYCVELDRCFNSTSEASRVLGISQTNICGCCNGKRFKTAGGYHWKYIE